MATDLTGVFNMALQASTAKGKIGTSTEVSREAEICTLWYETVRDHILRAAPWPCTRKTVSLAPLAERDFTLDWATGDPEPPWRYAYAYPSDMIRPRRLSNYARFTTALTNGARSVLTDVEEAALIYTMRQTTVAAWDADLLMAIVFGLASYISIPLTGKMQIANANLTLANQKILDARVNAANQDYEPIETLPPWLTARGYGQLSETRYVYPFGELLTLETTSAS